MAARVVITGMGIVSPIGIGISQFWETALRGQSGITAIKSFGDLPMEDYRSRIAGQIPQFQAPDSADDKFSLSRGPLRPNGLDVHSRSHSR